MSVTHLPSWPVTFISDIISFSYASYTVYSMYNQSCDMTEAAERAAGREEMKIVIFRALSLHLTFKRTAYQVSTEEHI